MILIDYLKLLLSFFKIGIAGFGGGYAMLSMVFTESKKFGITSAQFADLNALDMIVPGPIAINSATYVGFLSSGFWGALAATVGVSLPSFIIVSLVMVFIKRYKESNFMNGILLGIKPAAVGLVAAAAVTIASEVLVIQDSDIIDVLTNPFKTLSMLLVFIFVVIAVLNIKFKVNPILLTVLAGIVGAIFAS